MKSFLGDGNERKGGMMRNWETARTASPGVVR